MKAIATILAAILAVLATSQSPLTGMKDDVLTSSPAPASSGIQPLVHLVIVVVVLFALIKFVLPKLLLRVTNRLSPSIDSSIKIEESATIGTGGLYVITVRGKTLLVGASSTGGLSTLADLTEADKEERAVPAFFEILDEAVVAEPTAPKAPDDAPVNERLKRLLGEAGR